jgi:Stage II sporulation protein E (SpoIIE)
VPHAATPRAKHSSNPLDTIGGQLPLPIPIPDWSKPIIAALLLLGIAFGARSRLATRRARRLEQEDELLLEDLQAMQLALVPEVPAELEALGVSVASLAAAGLGAGGEFYDVFVSTAGKVAIMFGAARGRGREALAGAALTRYTLRAYLQAGLEPRAALQLAGRTLVERESFHFATAVLALYDPDRATVTYATAGRPSPVIYGSGALELPRALPSLPIGWGLAPGRRQTKVSLPAGTAACFFSDGLTDARQPDGAALGRGGLVEALRSLGCPPDAGRLLAAAGAEAHASRGDIAACIIAPDIAHHTTADVVFTYVEELEADCRELSGIEVRSFLEDCAISPAEITEALACAREIASRFDTALLTVCCGSGTPTVFATPPEPQTHEVALLPASGLVLEGAYRAG